MLLATIYKYTLFFGGEYDNDIVKFASGKPYAPSPSAPATPHTTPSNLSAPKDTKDDAGDSTQKK